MKRRRRRLRIERNPNHCYSCGKFCDSLGYCDDCWPIHLATIQRYEQRQKRETLGRMVREEWIAWAKEQPDIAEHPHWLTTWEDLPERDKEVDRRIGERLYSAGIQTATLPAPIKEGEA